MSLSEHLKHFLRINNVEYRKYVDADGLLHAKLMSYVNDFSSEFLRKTWALPNRLSRADALLRHVLIGDISRYSSFCEALETSGRQEALKYVKFVKPECGSSIDGIVQTFASAPAAPRKDANELLCDDYEKNLRKNYSTFYTKLEANADFLAQLRALPDGFTFEKVMTFEDISDPGDRATKILDAVRTGSLATYVDFRTALKNTGQNHLLSLLPYKSANTEQDEDNIAVAAEAGVGGASVLLTNKNSAIVVSSSRTEHGEAIKLTQLSIAESSPCAEHEQQAIQESGVSSTQCAESDDAPSFDDADSRAPTTTHIISDEYKNRLMRNVAHCGLKIKRDVPGDGNCFFHCIRDQLLRFENGGVFTSSELRQQLVTFMRNLDSTDPLADHLSNSYIDDMAQNGTWVDHVAVQAMARMIKKDFIIVTSMESSSSGYLKNVIPGEINGSRVCTDDSSCLLLGLVGEEHYVSLQPLDAQDSQGSPNRSQSADGNMMRDEDKFIQKVIKEVYNKEAFVIKLRLNGKRARALMINNIRFTNAAELNRTGADKDESRLTALFKSLNYEVVVYRDKTVVQIKEILESERKRGDHKLADSFILFVLSHGKKDTIYGSDYTPDNQAACLAVQSITSFFNGENCPFLRNKPKLFFIQACQGEQCTSGVPCNPDALVSFAQQVKDEEICSSDNNACGANDLTTVHPESDRLLVLSTVEGYVAYRDETKGSLFVRSLCDIFEEHSGSEDVLSMLTKVHDHMKHQTVERDGNDYLQMSDTRNNLSRKFYLLPCEKLKNYFAIVNSLNSL